MAVRNVPPVNGYDAPATRQRPAQRNFAELYRQARNAQVNDNGGNNGRGNTGRNAANDASTANAAETRIEENEENRKYIEGLHERVDTLRGELLVRVIQSGAAPREQARTLTGDISRLSQRLDKLREKLEQEENRLSGKLYDVEI